MLERGTRTMSFPLTTQVFHTVIQSQLASQCVQIISTPDNFVVGDDRDNDLCEIGILRRYYLGVFLEGYKFFKARNQKVCIRSGLLVESVCTSGRANSQGVGKNPAANRDDELNVDELNVNEMNLDELNVDEINLDEMNFGPHNTGKNINILDMNHHGSMDSGPFSVDVKAALEAFLVSCYLASLSMLLTTNEFSSVWVLHEKVLVELQGRNTPGVGSPSMSMVECDYKYMLALATSRMDRINKSSMLWHWIRRLSVQVIFASFDCFKFTAVLKQILRSMAIHFANYGAGYTFAWMVHMAQLNGYAFDDSAVLDLVRRACRASLSDISLWTLYGKLLLKPDSFGTKLFNDSALALGLPVMLSGSAGPFLKEAHALEEIRWLLAIDCQIRLPYLQLVPYLSAKELVALRNTAGNPSLRCVLDTLSPRVSEL